MDALERIACDLIAYLNAHHPKPDGELSDVVREGCRQKRRAIEAARQRDDAHAAYEKAGRERDAAVERADEWQQKAQRYINKFNRARNFNVEMKARADIEKALRESTNNVFASHAYPHMAAAVCALFGIEAEQAVDPVEERVDALADAVYGDELVSEQMRGVLERLVRSGWILPEGVECK